MEKKTSKQGQKRSQNEDTPQPKKALNTENKENSQEEMAKTTEIALQNKEVMTQGVQPIPYNHTDLQSIVINQLCQAPN